MPLELYKGYKVTEVARAVGIREQGERDIMMNAQASEVRVTRNQRVNQPPPCEHLTLKLEPNGSSSFTGNFYCIGCGEVLQEGLNRF